MQKQTIRTRPELKVALKEWAEDKDSFTTTQAAEELLRRGSFVHINNNVVAQHLRGVAGTEYIKEIQRWVKIRK